MAIAWTSLIFASFLLAYGLRTIIFLATAKGFAFEQLGFRKRLLHRATLIDNYQCEIGSHSVRQYSAHSIKSIYQTENKTNDTSYPRGQLPFVSILVATCDESSVISRLIKSFSRQTYPSDRFEIIIVDDSTDDTFDKILELSKGLPNLKAIHRDSREGWKGGALNVAIKLMNSESLLTMVVDADTVLLSDTLEEFVAQFGRGPSNILALQGFPISKAWLDKLEGGNAGNKHHGDIDNNQGNWVSRAIDLRLAQRNFIEFSAKQKMSLPIQITGSLFMIRADVLKATKFRLDLTEDWDLTLDLYLQKTFRNSIMSNDNYPRMANNKSVDSRPIVIFDPGLICYCEATVNLRAYFRQRMRVSEGHTRAFRKRMTPILQSKRLSLQDKFEIILTGLQYAKFIFIPIVVILDILMTASILLSDVDTGSHLWTNDMLVILSSMSIQSIGLLLALTSIIFGTRVCGMIRKYEIADIASLLILNLLTLPAFVIGSLRGFVRDNGVFYRTRRNTSVPKIADTAA